MRAILTSTREAIGKKPQAVFCLFLFFTSLFIYLANHHVISSGDNVPNSLLAFHWLFNHSLNFDAFRNSYLIGPGGICSSCPDHLPHFWVEAPNGHLTSTYPIGSSVLTFPLYLIFFLYIKLQALLQSWLTGILAIIPAVTDPGFEVYRQGYEKLAATIVASLSVVLFYLCTSLKFNPAIALTATFVYGFATETWVISSQALWQHSTANLAVLSLLLCLLKANRTEGRKKHILLLVAGIFCGLIPGIRPTSLLFSIAAVIYCAFAYRKEAIFFLLGLPSILFSVSWNFYYFGVSSKTILVGGYSRFSNTSFTASYYKFTLQQFGIGSLGLLLSPSRGLLIFSPVLLFAIPGAYQVFRLRLKKDEQLVGCLTIAALLVLVQYCFYTLWWAGWCYGPRFLTDILPVACYLICYFLSYSLESLRQKASKVFPLVLATFLALTLYSTFTQVAGAFGSTNWDGIPIASDNRLWEWQDTQLKRHTKALFYRLTQPIKQPRRYVRKMNGIIEQVSNANQQPIESPIVATPAQTITLHATLKNTGNAQWYGYQTGMNRGETRVRVEFFDNLNQPVETGQPALLYISGNPKRGKVTTAIGSIGFPAQPGDYRMVFETFVQGMGKFPRKAKRSSYELQATVVPAKT